MNTRQLTTDLATLVERIAVQADPRRILLIGSRARGEAREDSDFDLLVVAESNEPRHRRARQLYPLAADLPFEVEIVVYTPTEIEDWKRVPRSFVATALKEGRILYEKQ